MQLKGLSVQYSETQKKIAKDHVASMDADMGGTEMVEPFKWIYKFPVIAGYPRQVKTFDMSCDLCLGKKFTSDLQYILNSIAQSLRAV